MFAPSGTAAGYIATADADALYERVLERKDDVAQAFLARFTATEGVLFVGRAQEKALVWRTQRRYNPATGEPYAWLVRSTAFINYFYF